MGVVGIGTPSSDGRPPDVCVVGSLAVDLVVRVVRRPERGETVIASSAETYLGGKGFNQAVAAARAGARTVMVGAVGADEYGRRILDELGSEHIAAGGVGIAGDVATGMAFPVVEGSGDNTIIVVPGANHTVTVKDVERRRADIAGAAVVLLQFELPADVVVAAAAIGRQGGAIVVLNPAPAVVAAELFAGLVDIVVPNESELALLTRTGGSDPIAAAAALGALTGAASVVVTLGEQGAFVWTETATSTVAAHPVAVVDTVGAGDAFCGVLAARLAGGMALVEAVRHANAAGALATTRVGAEPSMPRRAEVERLLAAP